MLAGIRGVAGPGHASSGRQTHRHAASDGIPLREHPMDGASAQRGAYTVLAGRSHKASPVANPEYFQSAARTRTQKLIRSTSAPSIVDVQVKRYGAQWEIKCLAPYITVCDQPLCLGKREAAVACHRDCRRWDGFTFAGALARNVTVRGRQSWPLKLAPGPRHPLRSGHVHDPLEPWRLPCITQRAVMVYLVFLLGTSIVRRGWQRPSSP